MGHLKFKGEHERKSRETRSRAVESRKVLPANRPIRLIQCCTQFKSPGDKILCVLYLHYNVAFTFK